MKNDINKLSPDKVLNHRRLDIVVKYLYAKSLINNDDNGMARSLYARHIMMRTLGKEAVNEYGDSIKNSIEDYLVSFSNLIDSLKSSGFDNANPIFVGNDDLLLNGAHRLSAALALNENVFIERRERKGKSWDFDWFKNNGFKYDDLLRILKGYFSIKPNKCSFILVWKPALEHLGQIKKIIETDFNIVGEITHNFEHNYVAFQNVILDIYHPNKSRESEVNHENIVNKIRMLEADTLEFKVLLVEEKDDRDTDIVKAKEKLRQYLKYDISEKVYASVHTSDSKEEATHLANTLLCPNNIAHINMRLTYDVPTKLKSWCNELRQACLENDIDIDDVCVVGSAPMCVIGIKDVSDIDITIKTKYRSKFGSKPFALSKNIDIVSSQYHRKVSGDPITDDNLIQNSDYHFVFMGIKFVNLNIIKERKAYSAREKDLRHVRSIELFEKMHGDSLQKRVLAQRFRDEELRRVSKKKTSLKRKIKSKLGLSKK